MQRDIRETALYQEATALYERLRGPGTGQISDACDPHPSPDGRCVVFAGTITQELEGVPATRICQTDLVSGDTRVLSFGPRTDRLPKYSPDGRQIAFLSDRHQAGNFQLYLMNPSNGAVQRTPTVDGWVEVLQWSPDGSRILLGVAGHGADVAGVQGSITSAPISTGAPSWMPAVETGNEDYRWRRAWVYDIATNRAQQVGQAEQNIWEAVWCGNHAIAAVASTSPGEGAWYAARLLILDLVTGNSREIHVPRHQLGCPCASPSGQKLAFVEALCSDRLFVAGDLWVGDTTSGQPKRVDTRGVDISFAEWRSEQLLLLAGHRGLESVVGAYDAVLGTFSEVWCSRDITNGGFHFGVAGLNDGADCVLVGEGFVRAPEIALIRNGEYRTIKSLSLGSEDYATVLGAAECLSWRAPDGLEIQGWLLTPTGRAPHPLITVVHGGPVWLSRSTWLGRKGVPHLMLLKRGYAVFLPNPRGSTGRGQEFVQRVLGDMGGADTYDLLSGIDDLVQRGKVDPKRLGVTGISYGGFMSSWLITQDARFAAAVSVAPMTNYVSEHLISNVPDFVGLFLADHYTNPAGNYFRLSPIFHAQKARTPTLTICGGRDRCTPPEEAVQFHNALLENGVHSVLVTYPEEGHGIRKLPAAIDYAARLVGWFDEHILTRAMG